MEDNSHDVGKWQCLKQLLINLVSDNILFFNKYFRAILVILFEPGAFILVRLVVIFWIVPGEVKFFGWLMIVFFSFKILEDTSGNVRSGLGVSWFSIKFANISVFSATEKIKSLDPKMEWVADFFFNRHLFRVYIKFSFWFREFKYLSQSSCLCILSFSALTNWAFEFSMCFSCGSRDSCQVPRNRFFSWISGGIELSVFLSCEGMSFDLW